MSRSHHSSNLLLLLLLQEIKPVSGLIRQPTTTPWPWQLNKKAKEMRLKLFPGKLIFMLCIASFLAGSLFMSRTSIHSSPEEARGVPKHGEELGSATPDFDQKRVSFRSWLLATFCDLKAKISERV